MHLLNFAYFPERAVGEKRIHLVMNEEHGKAKEQIFDLNGRRWPTRFTLREKAIEEEIAKVEKSLQEKLEVAFRTQLAEDHAAVQEALKRLSQPCLGILQMVPRDDDYWFQRPTMA